MKIQGVYFTDAPFTAALSYGKPAFGRVSPDGVVLNDSDNRNLLWYT